MTTYCIMVEGYGLQRRFLVRTEAGTNVGKGQLVLYTRQMAEATLRYWRKKVNCSHLEFTILVAN